MTIHCPKCDADITDTFEEADYSVGINPGWYCEACDLGIAEHEVEREHFDDDVQIAPAPRDRPLGTPAAELASQPGTTPEQRAKYDEFCRIAASWGYD